MHEVSRRAWGLRLRRTEQELALSPLFMLPSAHYKDVGVRIASFRSSIAHPAYSPVYASLCTSRCPTQNSGPSGSLFLTRKNFEFSASCRFIPAHCNGDVSTSNSGGAIIPSHGTTEPHEKSGAIHVRLRMSRLGAGTYYRSLAVPEGQVAFCVCSRRNCTHSSQHPHHKSSDTAGSG